jgi:hypothetical protein
LHADVVADKNPRRMTAVKRIQDVSEKNIQAQDHKSTIVVLLQDVHGSSP